jgi:hypothetical protein
MNKPIVRAHRRFIRVEPYIGLIAASGLFSFIGKQLKVFGPLGWPEAIFLGTGAACVLIVTLAAGLAGWRFFKPLQATPPARSAAVPQIDARLKEIEESRPDFSRLAETDGKVTGLTFRVDELDAWKEQLSRLMTEAVTAQTKRLERLEGKVADVEANLGQAIAKTAASQSLSDDRRQEQIASLYGSLAAIFDREHMRELAVPIEEIGKELAAPIEQQTRLDHEEWEAWEAKERGWQSILKAWCDVAERYLPGIKHSVMSVSEEQYRQTGIAQASQFPEDGLIAYKAFWARLNNWRGSRGEADGAVHHVAFDGGTVERMSVRGVFDLEDKS